MIPRAVPSGCRRTSSLRVRPGAHSGTGLTRAGGHTEGRGRSAAAEAKEPPTQSIILFAALKRAGVARPLVAARRLALAPGA